MEDTSYDIDILRRIEDKTLNDQSLARDANILNDIDLKKSEVRKFFKDKCVLITGGTGFLGKIVLEKLLRSCSGIRCIFFLIRVKKGKNVQERLEQFFSQVLFDTLKREQPNFMKKVIPINGDIEQLNLGISESDREILQNQVSVIFHSAASVRFDQNLKEIVRVNVRGTAELLKLAHGCQRLESFVYFSTAYSNCIYSDIDEVFYESPIKPLDLIHVVENANDEELKVLEQKLLDTYPNTYVYSKAVAEALVREMGRNLPICLIRPSIIIATYREPLKGWHDNLNGPTGIVLGAGLGILHTFHGNLSKITDLVPVDMVANAAIVASCKTALDGVQSSDPKIYNFISGTDNPITWQRFFKKVSKIGSQYPVKNSLWHVSFTMAKCWYHYMFLVIFTHFLPALFFDTYFKLSGQKIRLLKIYKKIFVQSKYIRYFTIRNWNFKNNHIKELWSQTNITDQYLFHFNIKELEWERYLEFYVKGTRVYLAKDPLSTVVEGKKRAKKLKIIHYTTLILFYSFVLYIFWLFISLFF